MNFSHDLTVYLLRRNVALSASKNIIADMSPMEGVYTISVMPTINPPPTHVAAGKNVFVILNLHHNNIASNPNYFSILQIHYRITGSSSPLGFMCLQKAKWYPFKWRCSRTTLLTESQKTCINVTHFGLNNDFKLKVCRFMLL